MKVSMNAYPSLVSSPSSAIIRIKLECKSFFYGCQSDIYTKGKILFPYRRELHHPALNVTPDIAPVVDVQLVILKRTNSGGIILFQLSQKLPQLHTALSHFPLLFIIYDQKYSCCFSNKPGHVFSDMDVASFQHTSFSQNIFTVIEILKSDKNRPFQEYFIDSISM